MKGGRAGLPLMLTSLLLLSGCSAGDSDSAGPEATVAAPTLGPDAPAEGAPGGTALPDEPTGAAVQPPTSAPAEEPQSDEGSESGPVQSPTAAPSSTGRAVPASGPGETDGSVPMLAPVPMRSSAAVGGGYTASVTDISEVSLEGGVPGDVAGPGLAVAVRIANDGDDVLPLDRVTVSAAFGSGQEASGYDRPPADPFTGELEAGEDATAVYVFAVPPEAQDSLVVRVGPDPERVVAVFVAPDAEVEP